MKYEQKRYNRLHAGKLYDLGIKENDLLDDFFAR